MKQSRIFGFDVEYYVKSGAREPLALQRMSEAFERAAVEFGKFGEYAFPRLIPVLEQEVDGQFKAGGRGPNRGKWAPLSRRYLKRKQAGSGLTGLLERSGAMRDGLTKSTSPLASREYSASMLSYGTRGVTHASFHQTGTQNRNGTKRMVDRPPFDFTKEFSAEARKAALAGARDLVKKTGVGEFASGAAGVNYELDRGLDRALAGDR